MRNYTILIIDDSRTEAKSVTDILTGTKFSIRWADNAITGIEIARKIMPSLILMDVVMPGMNGFQAMRKIARDEKLKDIPVIMLTTKDQQTDIIWAQKQGAKAYIVKPANSEKLLSEINNLIFS
ncbi:MAG: response regulator [Ostreibacterium sp.]